MCPVCGHRAGGPDGGCCRLWGATFGPGNAYVNVGPPGQRRQVYADRWIVEQHIGRRVPGGLQALHLCDQPACVRLEHLALGTNRTDIRDAVAKGRQVPGTGGGRRRWGDDEPCPAGHVGNFHRDSRGCRSCRDCRRENQRRRRAAGL